MNHNSSKIYNYLMFLGHIIAGTQHPKKSIGRYSYDSNLKICLKPGLKS